MKLSHYTAIALAVLTLTLQAAIQATKDYCDRNSERAVTNALNSVAIALPTIVGPAVDDYMAENGIPTITTNTIIETYHENTITNNYYTNTYITNNIYTTEKITNIVSETTYQTNITYNISSDIITNTFEYITPDVWFDSRYIGRGFDAPKGVDCYLDNSWSAANINDDNQLYSYWVHSTNRWFSVNNITTKKLPTRLLYYATTLNNIYDDGIEPLSVSEIKLFGPQLEYYHDSASVFVHSNLAFMSSFISRTTSPIHITPMDLKEITLEICLYIQQQHFTLEEKYIPMLSFMNKYSQGERSRTLFSIVYASNDFASKYIDITNTNGISNIFSINNQYVDMIEFQYPLLDRLITYSICAKVIDNDNINVDAKVYANYRDAINVYNSYKRNILNDDFVIDVTNSLGEVGTMAGRLGICPRQSQYVEIENDYVTSSFPINLHSVRIYTNILSNTQRDYNATVDRNLFFKGK